MSAHLDSRLFVPLPDPSKAALNRKQQLLTIVAAVLVLSSAGSHLMVRLLGVRTDAIDRGKINADAAGQPILVTGSSVTFFGVSFQQVAKAMQRPIITRSAGGASPCELEPLLREAPEAKRLIIGVSILDLNESNLSDSRPTLVPLRQSVSDLLASHADWPLAKRILGTYPQPWLQTVFPFAGRSTALLVGVREKVGALRKHAPAAEAESRMTYKTEEDTEHPEKLSDWDAGRLRRNLSQITGTGLAQGRFDGPKSLAFARIIAQASSQEPTVLLVLPLSPPCRQVVIGPSSQQDFEKALERIKATDPKLRIIRLDQEPALQPAEVFWDLYHLNDAGRRIATRLVLGQISAVTAP